MFGAAFNAINQPYSQHIPPKKDTNSTTTYNHTSYSYGTNSNQPQQGSFGGAFADSFKPQTGGMTYNTTTTTTYNNGSGPHTTTTYSTGPGPQISTMTFDAPFGFEGFQQPNNGFGGGFQQQFGGFGGPGPQSNIAHPTFQISNNGNFMTGGGNAPPGYGGIVDNKKPDYYGDNGRFGGQTKPSVQQPTIKKEELGGLVDSGKNMFSSAFTRSCTFAPDSKYMNLVQQLRASGQKFTDTEFPCQLKSLTGGLSEYELAQNSDLDWRSVIWRRADDIFGKNNYQVFEERIEPNDIKQGSLGDCYFLSVLAALAEKPRRIRRLFESPKPNEQGCYAVKVCNVGMWTTILLDDYIPCSASTKKPIFSRSNGNELWVLLLEKAWAKIYGSYARIEAGLTRECLHDLTGAPTKYYLTGNTKKNEEIWTEISNGEKKDFVMTCGSGDFFSGADLMTSVGLVGSHAYSLLAALTVKDRYGRDVRLVKLRNPWGQGEWKGAWSDASADWTPELKRQLKIENVDDGIFYMKYEEMLKYFTDIQICKVHDDFKYKSLESSCDHQHPVFFNITVKESGHYYFTINQESKRMHAERDNYRYSEVSVVFGKRTANGYEYVEGIQKADKEVWTDGFIDAGEYVVYVHIHWNEMRTREFSISSYGAGDVEIRQVPQSSCPEFVEKVYMSKGRKAEKKEDYQHCGVRNCYRVVEITDDGFGYIYYKNESNKTLEEEIYFKSMDGLKFKKPYSGNSYKISVPAGQEKIVITKVLPNATTIRQAFTERSRFV
jgi:hypothetical protein